MHVGNVKEKITTVAKILYSGEYQSHYGGGVQTCYIHTLRDLRGNVLVWKTQQDFVRNGGGEVAQRGDLVEITGTVKEHSRYKGVDQTVLVRCKWKLVEE